MIIPANQRFYAVIQIIAGSNESLDPTRLIWGVYESGSLAFDAARKAAVEKENDTFLVMSPEKGVRCLPRAAEEVYLGWPVVDASKAQSS